jgi:outer membrane biosynthesis protein TonB
MDREPAQQSVRNARGLEPTGRKRAPTPGQMTAVMRAMSISAGPRVLRVGVVRAGSIVEERVIKQRITVTVGAAETAMFVVPSLATHAKAVFRLFERIGDDYWLNVLPGMKGRVALASGVTTIDGAAAGGPPLKLGDDARGKVILGDTTLLFQFVAPPVPQPRPQLPLGVKAGLRNDWTLTFIVAVSFLVHFGLVGTMYSDWTDPIVGDQYDVKGLVDLMAKIPAPPPIDVPEQPSDLATPTKPATPASASSATASAPPTSHKTPSPPSATRGREPRTPAETAISNEHAASLAASADTMKMQILIGLQGGPAVVGALDRSNVPPVDLGAVAERNVGVTRGNSDLKTNSGGPIAASRTSGLTTLGVTKSDGTGTKAGQESTTAGPTGVANIGISMASAAIPNADSVVAGLRGRFRSCYQTGLLADSTMTGKVVISAKVAPNGEVSSADIASISGLSPTVGQCIASVVKRATFGAPSGGGSSTMQIPVTFVQSK